MTTYDPLLPASIAALAVLASLAMLLGTTSALLQVPRR